MGYPTVHDMRIYADHAATTVLRPAALDATRRAAENAFGNPSSLHTAGERASAALADARAAVASLLGAAPDEVIFTSGGTESDNTAIRSAAEHGKATGRRHIVSTEFEHPAVLRTLEALEKDGFTVSLVRPDERGIVSAAAVETAIREDTVLVSVMLAQNEIGTIQPAGEIAAVCRARGALFHTDAVQAVGHIPVDFHALGADYLALSAHKFGGPRGIGVLLVRDGAPYTPLLLGGGQETGRRAGTENVPGAAGLAAALCEAIREMPAESVRLAALRDGLIARLTEIPGVMLNGDATMRLPGNVNVSIPGWSGENLVLRLDALGIECSSGSACCSGDEQPSRVLRAIGRTDDEARGSLRFSLGCTNTEEDCSVIDSALRLIFSET